MTDEHQCDGPLICGKCDEQVGTHCDETVPRQHVLDMLLGFNTYVEDGNVIELHSCGFVKELHTLISEYSGEQLDDEDEEESDD